MRSWGVFYSRLRRGRHSRKRLGKAQDSGGQGTGPRSPSAREPAAHGPVTHLTAHEEPEPSTRLPEDSLAVREAWAWLLAQSGDPLASAPGLLNGRGAGDRPLPLKLGSCGQGSR